jgi:hypothetical protein
LASSASCSSAACGGGLNDCHPGSSPREKQTQTARANHGKKSFFGVKNRGRLLLINLVEDSSQKGRSSEMKKVFCFAVSVIFLAASSVAFGADFWEKKDYNVWSKKECSKLLQDSPWAQDLTLIDPGIQRSTKTSDDGQQLYVKYQIQFRSALPMRQAVVRQMQILQKYESLAPEQKQQFDKSADSFLSADYSNAVLLYVTFQTNSRSVAMEIARYWQSQTRDLLKNTVFLRNSKGVRVDLAQFNPPQGGETSFQFIFPRQANGEPLLDLEDKSLILEFTYPVISIPDTFNEKLGDGRGYMEFKPKKMIYMGNLVY